MSVFYFLKTQQRFPTEDHLMIHRHKHEMTLKFPSIKNDNMLSGELQLSVNSDPHTASVHGELVVHLQNISLHGQAGQGQHQHSHSRMGNHDTSIVIQQALPSPSVQLRHHSGSIHQQTDRRGCVIPAPGPPHMQAPAQATHTQGHASQLWGALGSQRGEVWKRGIRGGQRRGRKGSEVDGGEEEGDRRSINTASLSDNWAMIRPMCPQRHSQSGSNRITPTMLTFRQWEISAL
ncbi:Cyclic AMP-responsive element-binding protein 5 [Collichthys lucidus]|uniref:Cyclic AMP-responsive element-binding protein 5 n=1 Tax=Collichthys lucidus TaxID=240159 RepID=A0A4U5V2H6_COLLU|nr:Cyclic AMP-responsive element-binding protein 5 [Collichthys lucidus]